MRHIVFLFIVSVFISCSQDQPKNDTGIQEEIEEVKNDWTFELLESNQTGIEFQNVIEESDEVNHLVWDAIYYGGGVAVGDLNNDGLQDLVFSGNQVDDAIYINKGDFQFEDVTAASGILDTPGWSNGVSLCDVNNDGFKDIYICRSGWLADNEMVEERANVLYINQGDMSFKEEAAAYGLDNKGYSTQTTWFDCDQDGDLDMFLLNAPSNNIAQKVKYNDIGFPEYCSDKLFRNDDGVFTDVSKEAGVHAFSFGLGVVAKDMNHDGLTDLYVANDYERPDYFYINQGDGTFKNELNDRIKHTCFTAMGVDAADINNDCLTDLMVLDMQSEDHFRSKTNMPTMQPETFWKWVDQGYNLQYMTNVLQLNNGVGYFSDIAQLAGVASTDWSWSVIAEDFNNDGNTDFHITNGINKDIRNNDFALMFEDKMAKGEQINLFELAQEAPSTLIPNYLFMNQGNLEFKNETSERGVGQASFSYGAATGDLDGDGDMDLIVNNNNMPPFVYRNQTSGNYLNVKIDCGEDNPDGLGSKVVLFYDYQKQIKEMTAVRGYQSTSEAIMHFGLGQTNDIDSMIVFFPNGTVVKEYRPMLNTTYEFEQVMGTNQPYDVYGKFPRFLQLMSTESGLDYTHRENDFDDYAQEVLLPHKQSTCGPFIASADVNADGLEDVFIGGAAGQSGALFIQENNGTFKGVQGPWNSDARCEDMGCVFLDVDGNGTMDLYVVSGGGHLASGHEDYGDRLYLNNGEGQFEKSPENYGTSNGSCAVSFDANGDGAMDLFVGGRGVPGKYPTYEPSSLFLNKGGKLELQVAADIENHCGLVTDADVLDYDGDGDMDLLVVGEWMAPTLFENNGGELNYSSWNKDLKELTGWWYNVTAADTDMDGQMDLVVGNIGVNNKFHVSDKKPLRVYENDIDGNDTHDVILSKMSKGVYVPLRGRECSSEQVPLVSEEFEDYESFASATIEEVYGEELGASNMWEVKEFRSGILRNTGDGFEFRPFDNEAQISAANGIAVDDFNRDGHIDILICGNNFDAEVETARHDASNGLFLKGNGSYWFEPVGALYTGFYVPENAKSMHVIALGKSGKKIAVVGNNNNTMKAFAY